MTKQVQADIYPLSQAPALTRAEFFSQLRLLRERNVAAHEMSYARLVNTCSALFDELAAAGILEPVTREELGLAKENEKS